MRVPFIVIYPAAKIAHNAMACQLACNSREKRAELTPCVLRIMVPPMVTLTDRLAEIFGSKAALAQAAGVNPSRVSRWGDAIPYTRMGPILEALAGMGVEPQLELVAPELAAAITRAEALHNSKEKESADGQS